MKNGTFEVFDGTYHKYLNEGIYERTNKWSQT